MSVLVRLGWSAFFEAQRASLADETEVASLNRAKLRFARVIEAQRGAFRLAGEFDGWAEVSGRFRHETSGAADFPAAGDWVGVHGSGERAIIDVRLERRSTVSRAAAGRAVAEQVLAANVDTIFLVTALARDLNPRRLERYLTMVWEGGAAPVVVLNKADLCPDPAAACEALRARLPFVDVVATSALQDRTGVAALDPIEALAPYLRPAQTVALLGSSGVGKSTLVNRLLGSESQRVSGLDADGKGRHTTTARQLIELPGGALLIDTPGLRELQPWADESAVESAFDDIAAVAAECRFADCAHEREPGCAVLAAVEHGRLPADRLEHYRRLLREAAFEERKRDKAAAANTKRRWKQMHQAAKAMYKERERLK